MYRRYLTLFSDFIGDLPLNLITAEHAEKFLSSRSTIVSDTSLSIELRTLKAAFNSFKRFGYIDINPFQDCTVRTTEQFPAFLTRADYDILMVSIKEQWYRYIITTALYTGMRREELLKLTWENVREQDGYIIVQSHANFRTKNGRFRLIPIHPIVHQVLSGLDRSDEYVFKQVKGRWISQLFTRYVVKCRLNPKLHFHSLRHTFASWLVQAGTPIYEVMQLMGHSDIKVTQKYAHLDIGSLTKSISRLK